MKTNEVAEELYEVYRHADRKEKPGLARALRVLTGFEYASERDDLSEVIRKSLIEHSDTLTTSDFASIISGDVIDHTRKI